MAHLNYFRQEFQISIFSNHSHPCETICIFTDRFLVPGIQLGYVHRNIILPVSFCEFWWLKLTMNYKIILKLKSWLQRRYANRILMRLKYELIISFIMCYDRNGSLKDYRWWTHAKTTAQHILVSNMALKRNTIIWMGSKIFSAQRKELQSHMQQELVFFRSKKISGCLYLRTTKNIISSLL